MTLEGAMKQVDIIVPVYNALDELKLCVESLKKYTDLSIHRIVLINDCSSDKEVISFLNQQDSEYIMIIHNESNLGFSANINKGISLSQNDIVLLNTDTIVTENWINKLIACAYSDDMIATATPLSNNATLCSIPKFGIDNEIPNSLSIEEYAKEIEYISFKEYPKIPVAVGFCMYIKRKVLEEVGFFDAETFGRGYGEENDFCNRAIEIGYHHVICDDTFIYHKGTASFQTKEKKEYIEKNNKIVCSRYPKLMNETLEKYLQQRPNWEINENIKMYRDLNFDNGKKNLLYYLLADFREDAYNNIGGTQLHVKDLVLSLKDKYNVFVAAREQDHLRVTAYIGEKMITFQFYIGAIPDYNIFRDKTQGELYHNILKAFRIDLLHVHHTMRLPLDIYYVAETLEIPIVFTMHDYYYICPVLKLMNTEDEICIGNDTTEMCAKCLLKEKEIYEEIDYISKWRMEHKKVLEMCEQVIVPSDSVAEIFKQYFPAIKTKLKIIPHGIEIDTSFIVNQDNLKNIDHTKLRIAFIGGISDVKGGKLIYDLIVRLPKTEYEWFIFGGIGYEDLYYLKQDNLKKTGWYKRNDLNKLLKENHVDIVCILSLIPETFCYTLSESLMCNIPVIATDIGALGERAHQLECGWIVPRDVDYRAMQALLKQIKENPKEYQEKCDKIKNAEIQSVSIMKDMYIKLYESIIVTKNHYIEYDTRMIFDAYIKGNKNELLETRENLEILAHLRTAQTELNEIKDSLSFKLVSAMREVRFPFKNKLKELLIKFRK